MKPQLIIEVNDQPVQYSKSIPKKLSMGLFPSAGNIIVCVPEVDILVQIINIDDRSFWQFDFIVDEKVKICFKHPDGKLFILINIGEDVLLQFGSLEAQFFKSNHHNVITATPFEMAVFPRASNKKYQLLLLDIVGKEPNDVMDKLLMGRFDNLTR